MRRVCVAVVNSSARCAVVSLSLVTVHPIHHSLGGGNWDRWWGNGYRGNSNVGVTRDSHIQYTVYTNQYVQYIYTQDYTVYAVYIHSFNSRLKGVDVYKIIINLIIYILYVLIMCGKKKS